MSWKSLNIFTFVFLSIFSFKSYSISELNGNDFKKIAYTVAASKGIGKSTFGHAYLHFMVGEKPSEKDLLVEFVADVEARDIDYARGIGIGENYGVRTVIRSFKKIQDEHNFKQNRDLTTYVLDLPIEQKNKVIDSINSEIKMKSDQTYSFFYSNCAKLVSDIFKEIIPDFSGFSTVVPILIPDLLKEKNLVIATYKELSVEGRRKALFNKAFPKQLNLEDTYQLYLQNIEEQLTSNSLSDRLHAYYKIHYLRTLLPTKLLVKLNIFAIKMLKFESFGTQSFLMSYFNSKKSKMKFITIEPVQLSNDKLQKLKTIRLSNNGNKVIFLIEAEVREEDKRIVKEFDLELSDSFSYKQGVFKYKGSTIAYTIPENMSQSGFTLHDSFLKAEIVKVERKNKVLFTLMLDKEPLDIQADLTDDDILSVKNGSYGMAMCHALVEMQSLLFNRVLFEPNAKPLSKEKNFELVKELYRGEMIVVPGYDSIRSFTESLDEEEFAKIIFERQKKEFDFYNQFKGWFSQKTIDDEEINSMKNLLKLNIKPMIFFKVENKSIGHSILINEITEDEEFYYIGAYDPNTGVNKIKNKDDFKKLLDKDPNFSLILSDFRIRKSDFTLITTNYGESKAILPSSNLSRFLTSNIIHGNKSLKNNVIKSSILGNRYHFSPYLFY